MSYDRRILDEELDELMYGLPAIAIEGPRAVGKTTTAAQRAAHIIRLDSDVQRQLVASDMARLQRSAGGVLIDEWQRLPASWDYVRRAVDDGAGPGSFILTGSAAPATAPTHTGAGRIASLRMRPLSLAERNVQTPSVSLRELLSGSQSAISGETSVTLTDYVNEIMSSGFPGIRPLSARQQRAQLDGYLTYALTHEVSGQPGARNPDAMRRWLTACAAATASTCSYNAILDAATPGESDKPARSTSEAYRNALSQLWLLDPLPGWVTTSNELERLTQSPKHHLADPALAARLLGLNADVVMSGRSETRLESGVGAGADYQVPRPGQPSTILGALFESLVTLSVRTYAQNAEARVSHARTQSGRQEIDMIVTGEAQSLVAIEVNLSATVRHNDVKHLLWLKEKLGSRVRDCVVVTTGPYAYRRQDGVAVVPAALLGP